MADETKKAVSADAKKGADKKADVKKSKKAKLPLWTRIKNFFKDYKSELKKVTWSSRKDVMKNSAVVLVVTVVTGIVVGLLDLGLSEIVRLLGSIN